MRTHLVAGRLLLVSLALGILDANPCARADEPPPDGPPATDKAEESPAESAVLADDFNGPLDEARWEPIRIRDTRSERIETEDGELTVALDTLETDDATVKLRGVRSRAALEVPSEGPPLRIELTLDWGGQHNGSYLTAGLALVPAGERGAPHAAERALAFEFVGVPPGRNARPFLWERRAGALRPLYTEGWPQARREDRTGRPIRRVKLALEIGAGEVRLLEDGRERFAGPVEVPTRAHLVLFVTGHSNYPERTIRFDDLRVARKAQPTPRSGEAPAGDDRGR